MKKKIVTTLGRAQVFGHLKRK